MKGSNADGTGNAGQLQKILSIFLQDACLEHRYIRNRDTSLIVERPERIRAVKVGISVALARLEYLSRVSRSKLEGSTEDDLAAALGRMAIHPGPTDDNDIGRGLPIRICKSGAKLDLLTHPAVKFVHGDIEGDVYLEKLKAWARESTEKISKGESEIPEGLPQGDLYFCPTSIDAIEGALGTVCEAVDTVTAAAHGTPDRNTNGSEGTTRESSRAFVAIRPPGHHCGEDSPSGFCFVNNVVVSAAHAHLHHGINRVVILDIDLHHGNGTQSLVWQINEETYRKSIESEYSGDKTTGLQIYYGSVHDILSYPCEDGKLELVQAASVSIHGPHGQHIENVHLQPYESLDQFWNVLYQGAYSRLLTKAGEFLDSSGGPGDDALIFISCGFDACEHEYASMSRHQRKVPVSFYRQFARDTCALAEKYARGRLVSVLEGGYGDRALTSGAMAHVCGLLDMDDEAMKEEWWNVDNLVKIEKATKKKSRSRQSLATSEPWLQRTVDILSVLDEGSQYSISPSLPSSRVLPPSNMTLRERKKNHNSADIEAVSPPLSPPKRRAGPKSTGTEVPPAIPPASTNSEENIESGTDTSIESHPRADETQTNLKRLPKVILHVRPPPDAES